MLILAYIKHKAITEKNIMPWWQNSHDLLELKGSVRTLTLESEIFNLVW